MFDQYVHLTLNDVVTQPLAPVIQPAMALLKRASPDYPVLVHCAMGVSRSAAVVIAHLLFSRHSRCLSDALVHVAQARPIVYPNRGFLAQLRELEEFLYNEKQDQYSGPWPVNVIALHGDLLGVELSRGVPLTKQQLEDLSAKEAAKWKNTWRKLYNELK